MEKLLIIDGNSLLFRSFYATFYDGSKLLRSKNGTPTNALMALGNIAFKIIEQINPTYSVVAFDTDKPTFRHQNFESYKAQRKPAPEELILQMNPAREMLNLFGLNCLELAGYEADDIIGTFAALAIKENVEVIIYSGDRDLLQLINENVKVYLTIKGVTEIKIMDEKALMEDYQLKPSQIPDLKGLMGDSSDNIPGIPGIGEKTATKLILEYQSVENLIANIDKIPGKLKDKIIEGKELGLMSKELATIYTNVPIDCCLEKYPFNRSRFNELKEFFLNLDMINLSRKVDAMMAKNELSPANNKTRIEEEINVKYIDKVDFPLSDIDVIIAPYTQENYHLSKILGLTIATNNQVYFIALADLEKDVDFIKYLSSNNPKYGFNIKATINALKRYNIDINNFVFDFYLGAYLLNSSLKNDPAIIFNEFDKNIAYLDTIFKKGISDETVIKYFALIAKYTLELVGEMNNRLSKLNMLELFNEIEVPLATILAKMESFGVKVDRNVLEELNVTYKAHLAEIAAKIYDLIGHSFNVDSPKQLSEVLFEELNLPANKKRSTGIEVLESLIDYHPVINLIIEYRKYAKLISTYSEGLQSYIFPDSKFHTIYNQATTTTGRLSSVSPNLQQIAVKDDRQKQIRKAFVPSLTNSYLLSVDYSQIELRVLASIGECQEMIDAFNKDIDIHTETASKIFNIPLIAVTSEMRRRAKAVNFGIIYGMSNWGLSESIKISPADAKNFIKLYFEKYPSIKEYLDKAIQECKEKGYITTIFNRRRYVKEINDSNFMIREFGKRLAMNSPIQGSAADIMKKAMIDCDKYLNDNQLKSRLIMQIHDELIFEVPEDELNIMTTKMIEVMENTVKLKVKLKCEFGYGRNWYNAK